MKIYGYNGQAFNVHRQEPGILCGYDDVLLGGRLLQTTFSFLGETSAFVQPKLYLHIPKTAWSSFTGALREYCMPWAWKSAYLDQENGQPPQRILVCTNVHNGELPGRIKELLGQSLFVTQLINANCYEEILGKEHLRICRLGDQLTPHVVNHFLGAFWGISSIFSPDKLCHIHRIRGIYSLVKYHLLKHFSSAWEEAAVRIGDVSENVLIKRDDREAIARAGFIRVSS